MGKQEIANVERLEVDLLPYPGTLEECALHEFQDNRSKEDNGGKHE